MTLIHTARLPRPRSVCAPNGPPVSRPSGRRLNIETARQDER